MAGVVHFEIHASDPDRLSAFYADVFGWAVTPLPQMDYWLLNASGGTGIGGGMVRRRGAGPVDGGAVNAFVCSIGVDSVDASFAKALDCGGSVAVPKMPIPGVGWQAYIKDPDGNIVGLHQPDPAAK